LTEWAQLSDSSAPCRTPQDYSSTSSTIPESSTVVLTQEYNRLRQLEFSHTNLSATYASASGMHTYTLLSKVFDIRLWSLISHMTGITQKFVSLNMSIVHPSVKIADDTHSPILGNGVVHATPALTLINILYVPRFPVSFSSINQLTNKITAK